MNKILLATTALVLTAGMAAAEVKLKGDARFGLQYTEGATPATTLHQRARVQFNMAGTTDGGLDFGTSFRITSGGADIGKSTVWISGTFGKLAFGDVDSGDDSASLGIADIGIVGIGVDNLAETYWSKSDANVLYTNSFGPIDFGVSYDLGASEDWAAGVNYKGGTFEVGVGVDSLDTASVGGMVKAGAITANAIYSDRKGAANNPYGVDVSYKAGAATVTVAYGNDDAGTDGYGLGVSYDLGGGAKLVGGVGVVDGTTEAELGMTFSF